MKALVFTGCASLLLCGAGVASAQTAGSDAEPPPSDSEENQPPSDSPQAQPSDETGAYGGEKGSSTKAAPMFDHRSMSVTAGGGVVGYSNDETNDFIDTGGAYQVRLQVGSRSMLGLELAYVGSANDIEALGLDPDATVLGNGVEGALRYNITVTKWQPYLLVGAAWKSYSVVNDNFNTSATVNDSDGVFEVPLALGLTWHQAPAGENGLVADARLDYRLSAGNDLLGGANGGGPDLNNWVATLRAGWEF